MLQGMLTLSRRPGTDVVRQLAAQGVTTQALDSVLIIQGQSDIYDLFTFELAANPFARVPTGFDAVSNLHGAGLFPTVTSSLGVAAGVSAGANQLPLPGVLATFTDIFSRPTALERCASLQ